MKKAWEAPKDSPRSIAITLAMFLFAFVAILYALSHEWPIAGTILLVVIAGSLPWVIYNLLARLLGWQRSHIGELIWYWLDAVLGIWP